MCKRSFAFFVREFWEEIDNEPLIWNWHLDVYCHELEQVYKRVFARLPKEYDLLVNVPPGTTKSKIFTIMGPVYGWINDPKLKFINGSYSSDLSLEHAGISRDLIKSKRFELYFPEMSIRSDRDSKGAYQLEYYDKETKQTKYGGTRYATSVGGTVTGMHAHIITIDDPLNPKKAASDVEIKSANHWMGQTLSTRKVSKSITPTILVMQRLAEEDSSGVWKEYKKTGKKEIRHICLPGEIFSPNALDDVSPPCLRLYYTDDLLDPNRMSRKVLKEAEAELGQYGYAGQILQSPSPPEGGMFKVENLKIIDSIPKHEIAEVVRFWDNAGTDKETNPGSAHTAGVKMARLHQPNCHNLSYVVLDVVRGQWEADEREKNKLLAAQLDGSDVTIYVEQEPGSSGKDVAKATVKYLAGFAVHPEPASGDKVKRADPYSVQVKWGQVGLLRGDWNKDYVDELRPFPFGKWKDQVDASSGAFNKLHVSSREAGVWGR